jgi:hypothetical protein
LESIWGRIERDMPDAASLIACWQRLESGLMTIDLDKKTQHLIDQEIQAGRFGDAATLMSVAVRRQSWLQALRAPLPGFWRVLFERFLHHVVQLALHLGRIAFVLAGDGPPD